MQNQYQEFFKQIEFGLEFDFNRLAQATSPEFAKEIEDATGYNNIVKMDIFHNTYTFYVVDVYGNTNRLITAVFLKEYNDFTIDFIPAYILERMGLQITKVS